MSAAVLSTSIRLVLELRHRCNRYLVAPGNSWIVTEEEVAFAAPVSSGISITGQASALLVHRCDVGS
jgi:hypothetical protein